MKEENKSLLVVNNKKNNIIKEVLIDVYDDEIYKLQVKKQKLDYEKYKMENIKYYINENPLVGHYISKMMLYKIKLDNINDKINESLINKINNEEVLNLNNKINLHRKSFYRYIKRDNIDIEEEDINKLVKKEIKYYPDKEINLEETINNAMINNSLLIEKNEGMLMDLTNKLLTIKNIKWYQLIKRLQIRKEYNILKQNN